MPPTDQQRPGPEGTPRTDDQKPLRSVHSTTFPALLNAMGASLLVTTYQAGKLVIVRSEGDHLNTHFRNFRAPMGLALDGDRVAVGTKWQVWEFHDLPGLAPTLPPAGRHDACFMPRSSHYTGNILVHEMAWGSGGELWLVNTRFSCLCTLDHEHSFVPRWRPPFVSALAAEDRCHLNGLGMVDGLPRYATALGVSDERAGWRPGKASGGVLVDVPSGEFVCRGLSMPHSPRWHDGKLWVLESGAGTIGVVDPATGRYDAIAELPGFTRGLDFFGKYAFVGLSQVRESAVFSGLPLTERLAERSCGVWVVDTVAGRVVALLKFEDAVQEVFAVQILPGRRYPDLLNDDEEKICDAFVLPTGAMAEIAASAPPGAAEAPRPRPSPGGPHLNAPRAWRARH